MLQLVTWTLPVIRAAPKERNLSKVNVRRKKRPRPTAAYQAKLNNQNRLFRKGLRQG
jgi:hypothetical protein